jgi:hypothetical protein
MNVKQKSLTPFIWLSVSAAVITIILKTAAYFVTGSVGLLSDALESIINLVAAVSALLILRLAEKPPDEDHVYGHTKAEYFSSIIESVLIIFAAISIGYTAVDRLMHPKALEMVGLGPRAHHFPSQMSGGEQQRVAIARAIAKQPKMLFCDEPTGALDVHTGILVLDAIQKTCESLGTTTVIITHNVTIADMADRVIHLVDGQIKDIKKIIVVHLRKSSNGKSSPHPQARPRFIGS